MKMRVRKPTQAEIDSTACWETWTGEPSVFPYDYEQAIYFILEGKAKVKDDEGNEISFAAGDWVEFAKGLKTEWKIIEKVHKRFSVI
jgi:uncharacterized cupin superfamily protein